MILLKTVLGGLSRRAVARPGTPALPKTAHAVLDFLEQIPPPLSDCQHGEE